MAKDILLIHGSFHDETCWAPLIPELEKYDFQVHTLTLIGNEGEHKSAFSITLNQYVNQVIKKVKSINQSVILVGHSMAGAIISVVGEKHSELIEHLMYLSAIVPRKTDRIINMSKDLPNVEKSVFEKALKLTFQSVLKGRIDIDRELAKEGFYSQQNISTKQELVKKIIPQPIRPFLGRINWTEKNLGRINKSYIECKLDQALPIDHQRAYQKYMNFNQVKTLESDHSPFHLMPDILAKTIKEICNHKN